MQRCKAQSGKANTITGDNMMVKVKHYKVERASHKHGCTLSTSENISARSDNKS